MGVGGRDKCRIDSGGIISRAYKRNCQSQARKQRATCLVRTIPTLLKRRTKKQRDCNFSQNHAMRLSMHVREFNTLIPVVTLHKQQLHLPSLSFVLHYPVWDILVALSGMAQQPQKPRFPFLPLCAVVVCVQTVVWLPVYGNFNVRTDVDACDCTLGAVRTP